MATQWYCKIGDRQYGPLLLEQLERMAQQGQLTPTSQVRRSDSGQWVAAAQVDGIAFDKPSDSRGLPQAQPLAAGESTSGSSPPPRTNSKRRRATPPQPKPPAAPPPPRAATSVAPATPPGPTPVYDNTPPAAAEPAHSAAAVYHERRSRGSTSTLWLILGGGGLVAVIAAIVVAFALMNQDNGAGDESDTNLASAKGTGGVDDGAEQLAENEGAESSSHLAVAQLVASIDHWRAPRSTVRIKKPIQVELRLVSFWIGDDASYSEPTVAAPARIGAADDPVLNPGALGLPTDSNTFESEAPTQGDSAKNVELPSGKYVLVRVELTNTSEEEALKYVSWNREHDNPAVLIDSANRVCRLIAANELSAEARLEDVQIAPQSSVVDVLVFETPQDDFDLLRLVLPYAAFGLSKHAGFEIPRSMLAASVTRQSDNSIAKPVESDGPRAPRPPDKSNPSLDPITRGIQELDRRDRKD